MVPPTRLNIDVPERAVSPLIGNLLLIAVVVIMGSVITIFAFGYLDSLQAPAPQAKFSGEFSDQGTLTLTHTQGEQIAAQDISVRVTDATGERSLGTWETISGVSSDVSAGDSIRVSGFNGDETVFVIWQPVAQDRSHVLSEFQTRNILSPLSAASVTESTGKFASQTGAFGSRAWQALGRIGGAGWEVVASQDDQPDNGDQQAEYNWQNGKSVPFTLKYNQNGNEEASLTIDGSTATADTATYPDTGDTIGLTLRATDPSRMSVSVSNLRLDGLVLSQQSATTDTNQKVNLLIDDDSIENGFVLTGSVTFSWSGAKPANSNMQLNFEIEERGTGSS